MVGNFLPFSKVGNNFFYSCTYLNLAFEIDCYDRTNHGVTQEKKCACCNRINVNFQK